ncbi:sulfatase [Akkermansiaceae bacterium]|nr:sulfatase [Akkermansiaceae bacterium]MDB4429582.1 sulfatase [Akkermansiaceae bacterium]MDB4525571.1 sulfatase [Akkermansiaceae bacterium]
MNRFLSFVCAILWLPAAGENRPNVVLILSDDQSWTDYSFMGHKVIETPALDQFAKESLTYTRGYVTSPLCRPSLASIFSGLHTPVHGITGNDVRNGREGQKKWSRTETEGAALHEQIYADFEKRDGLARLLTKAGYLSLQTGKWWEGKPQRHGFTHAMTHADPAKGGRHGDVGLKISRTGIQPIQNFMDEAKKEKKPFFIWHAPFLPHTPHNPPKELFDKYLAKGESKFVARYYAMVEWFDQTCGELFQELEKRGVADNTIIIYVTDNGWIQSADSAKYAPLSKQAPYEMGIRTPIMVKWTGKVSPKMDDDTLVSAIDIAPTILKVAGVEVPEAMTGLDLRDTAALKKRDIVFGFDGNHDMFDVNDRTASMESRYVVQGDWKLLLHDEKNYGLPYSGKSAAHPDNPEGKPELYNVKADPHEKKNLAEKNPEKVAELTKALNAWWKPGN